MQLEIVSFHVHILMKKSASRDGTLLVRRDSLILLPSSASSLPHPAACHHLFVLYRLLLVLHLLLILYRPSLASCGSPSFWTLPPSSLSPPRLPAGCTLTCNEPDRPAGTQLPLAPCISESVSQSVSHWVSQSVSRIDTREEISFIVTMYILYSRHSRSLLLSLFLVVFFLVLSCEIYSHRGSFGRVECWPRASLFAARVQRMRRKMCTCRVHCVYDSLGRVSDRVRLTYFQEVRSMHHAAYA